MVAVALLRVMKLDCAVLPSYGHQRRTYVSMISRILTRDRGIEPQHENLNLSARLQPQKGPCVGRLCVFRGEALIYAMYPLAVLTKVYRDNYSVYSERLV